jgi:hypothetical protein
MGSKPKKQDYQASEAEKTSASVAMAERNYFKQKYDPLLRNMRDQSFSDDNRQNLRGRANADTMQALTKDTSFANTQRTGNAGLASNALLGQLGIAEKSAGEIKNTMQTGVLGTARGQAADAQTGMAQASRLATSDALNRAKNNNLVRGAKMKAIGKMARAATSAYGEKYGDKIGADGETIKGSGLANALNKVNSAYDDARAAGY